MAFCFMYFQPIKSFNMKFNLSATLFLLLCIAGKAQPVRGKVTDDKGLPLGGVTVLIKNGKTGTTTDQNGMFAIERMGDSILLFSAIGFDSLSYKPVGAKNFIIRLHPVSQQMSAVRVTSGKADAGTAGQVLEAQAIAGDLNNFVERQNINAGQRIHIEDGPAPRIVTYYNAGAAMSTPRTAAAGNALAAQSSAPAGRFYLGTFLPVFTHREDAKGSRYLLDHWVKASLKAPDGQRYDSSGFLFNYDKITKTLWATANQQTAVEVSKEQVSAFVLLDDSREYFFALEPMVDKENLLQIIVAEPGKYSLYKMIKARFEKANYMTSGLTESGHDYDEYVDEPGYFVLFPSGQAQAVQLKRKIIREIFEKEPTAKAYLSAHKSDTVNEEFLKQLIRALNE